MNRSDTIPPSTDADHDPISYVLTESGHAAVALGRPVPVNWEPNAGGKVRAVCQWYDKRSRPVTPSDDGRPGFWDLHGWTESPYPLTHRHRDGSHGSLFTCPACQRLRAARQAAGILPLLTPAAHRAVGVVWFPGVSTAVEPVSAPEEDTSALITALLPIAIRNALL